MEKNTNYDKKRQFLNFKLKKIRLLFNSIINAMKTNTQRDTKNFP